MAGRMMPYVSARSTGSFAVRGVTSSAVRRPRWMVEHARHGRPLSPEGARHEALNVGSGVDAHLGSATAGWSHNSPRLPLSVGFQDLDAHATDSTHVSPLDMPDWRPRVTGAPLTRTPHSSEPGTGSVSCSRIRQRVGKADKLRGPGIISNLMPSTSPRPRCLAPSTGCRTCTERKLGTHGEPFAHYYCEDCPASNKASAVRVLLGHQLIGPMSEDPANTTPRGRIAKSAPAFPRQVSMTFGSWIMARHRSTATCPRSGSHCRTGSDSSTRYFFAHGGCHGRYRGATHPCADALDAEVGWRGGGCANKNLRD